MTTTNTIGTTGRNYSTLQAWEDAVPATPTGGYIGECYNDSEFTAGITIAGHTTSAANFIRLTAAAGQSFQDDASVRTNALFYDQTKGVGVVANPFSVSIIDVQNDFVEILRLQVKRTADSYGSPLIIFSAGLGSAFTKDCIYQKTHNQTGAICTIRESTIINCLALDTGGGTTTAISVLNLGTAGTIINCTVVRSSALGAGGSGCVASATYTSSTVKNTVSMGWTTAFSASGWASSSYNCSDQASPPGTNGQASKTFANQFQSTTNDFRLKTGSDCIDLGNTDATNAPNDISATARGLTTAGDIGAWEFVAAGGSVFTPYFYEMVARHGGMSTPS